MTRSPTRTLRLDGENAKSTILTEAVIGRGGVGATIGCGVVTTGGCVGAGVAAGTGVGEAVGDAVGLATVVGLADGGGDGEDWLVTCSAQAVSKNAAKNVSAGRFTSASAEGFIGG